MKGGGLVGNLLSPALLHKCVEEREKARGFALYEPAAGFESATAGLGGIGRTLDCRPILAQTK
jgi:hypothetical protein